MKQWTSLTTWWSQSMDIRGWGRHRGAKNKVELSVYIENIIKNMKKINEL